jgi:hypothetical protein
LSSAPLAIRSFAMLVFRRYAAWCNGVALAWLRGLTLAPLSISSWAISRRPWEAEAAMCKTVSPVGVLAFTSAPAATSIVATSVLPRRAAQCNAVRPVLSFALTSLPRESSD